METVLVECSVEKLPNLQTRCKLDVHRLRLLGAEDVYHLPPSLSQPFFSNTLQHFECVAFRITDRDLGPLSDLQHLHRLILRGCRLIRDIRPLSKLSNLKHLELRGFRRLTDITPLSSLHALQVKYI